MQLLRLVGNLPRPAVVAGALALALPGGLVGVAQARPNTLSMSCSEAAGMVKRQGAIVLGTGPNVYDRYVSDIRYCSGFEQLRPEWVATRDSRQCFIGYTCYVPDRNDWGR